MGALPKLGVRWCWLRKKLPLKQLEMGFYAAPLQRTHFWRPREGGRLKESLVFSPLSFRGRRRCSHRAFIKGASFICPMVVVTPSTSLGASAAPTIPTQLPSRKGNQSCSMWGHPHPSPPWTEHAELCIQDFYYCPGRCVLSSSTPNTWKHHILTAFQAEKAWKRNLGAHIKT